MKRKLVKNSLLEFHKGENPISSLGLGPYEMELHDFANNMYHSDEWKTNDNAFLWILRDFLKKNIGLAKYILYNPVYFK